MQIVSNRDSLLEMSNPVFWEKNKKNIMNLLSAELAQRAVKVKHCKLNLKTAPKEASLLESSLSFSTSTN